MEPRFSKSELEEFRVLIEGKLQSAEQELKHLKEGLTESNSAQGAYDTWNDLGGHADKEYLAGMIERQARFIRDLRAALGRIANGTYGVCRVTGKLIEKGRLRAVPHTTLSLEAKTGAPAKRR
jgi:RNA polymerase-binding transcription factor DksA